MVGLVVRTNPKPMSDSLLRKKSAGSQVQELTRQNRGYPPVVVIVGALRVI